MKARSVQRWQLMIGIACLHLFERSRLVKDLSETQQELKDETDFGRIRCPLCLWQPRRSDRWCCVDCAAPEYFFNGCGTQWNTFETRGICPGCGHQWQWTACLACHGWSLHDDWYVEGKDS
jgi:hypothetical protein